MNIHESMEDYLETILILSESGKKVRSIDIVRETNYSKPSVSIAMRKLKEKGLIDIDSHNFITLTTKGMEIAEKTYDRHKILTECLVLHGVPRDIAEIDACKIEHELSEETYAIIKKFVLDNQK